MQNTVYRKGISAICQLIIATQFFCAMWFGFAMLCAGIISHFAPDYLHNLISGTIATIFGVAAISHAVAIYRKSFKWTFASLVALLCIIGSIKTTYFSLIDFELMVFEALFSASVVYIYNFVPKS
jgi:hypothetical protein